MPVVRDHLQDILEISIPMVRLNANEDTVKRLINSINQFVREPVSPIFVTAVRTELAVVRSSLKLVGADMEDAKKRALVPVDRLDTILLAFQEYFVSRSKT